MAVTPSLNPPYGEELSAGVSQEAREEILHRYVAIQREQFQRIGCFQ